MSEDKTTNDGKETDIPAISRRLAAVEKRLSEQGINELADAIEKRIVSRMKYGRNPRIEKGE